MEFSGPQASTCDAESERLHELSRWDAVDSPAPNRETNLAPYSYYCTLRHPFKAPEPERSQNGLEPVEEHPAPADLSKDIALTALTQLGVHRLNANRAFVSIIDGDSQHIIAEATKSISLRDKSKHASNDDIYLGTLSLDLQWGVCPFIMPLFTGQDLSHAQQTPNVSASQTRYIVRDFTKEDCFKERPYVVHWPFMRFYAEVPLFSPSGHVLGSYCVIDDKPREEFDEQEVVDTLRDIADAIGDHLENVRIAYFHHRAERWVKGLTTFVKDGKGFNPQEVSSHHRLRSMTRPTFPRNASMTPAKLSESTSPERNEARKDSVTDATRSSTTSLFEDTPPFFSSERSTGGTEPSSISSLSDTQSVTPGIERSTEEGQKTDVHSPTTPSSSQDSLSDSTPMSERMNTIFTRASILLQESLDLDGVTFLDAAQNPTPASLSSRAQSGVGPGTAALTPEFPTAPCASPLAMSNPLSNPLEVHCQVLGSAVKAANVQGCAPEGELSMAQSLLDLLVSHFPQGQVFNLTGQAASEDYLTGGDGKSNSLSTSKNQQIVSQEITRLLPDAKSALFFPLWDYTKSRWMAGTLVWTKHTRRPLGVEELHYFKVFGNSIISEISRAHWASVEKSKFDFISSVSHELRSPLHGILASAELLKGTSLQPPQKEMVRMIESSGLTLLDTTDHLLDFCKINSLAKVKKTKHNFSRNDTSILVSGFDLGYLVEEVTNILYRGQRAPVTSARAANRFPANTTAPQSIEPAHNSDEVSVIVRIEQNHPWEILSQPGAWRRIVMNLLGNAIKWTNAGFVEVSLSHSRSQTDPQKILAHLSIMDTGCGISPDFLRHKLFTPFTQEDPLDEGVGLGLSIVRQLVESLGGHINVQSELEIGTQVDVHIPVEYLRRSVSQASHESIPRPVISASPPLHACLVGFNGYPDLNDPPTGMLTVEAKRKLSIQSTLADVFLAQTGWSVSLVDSLEKATCDVVVIEENTLQSFTARAGSIEGAISSLPVKAFVVLGSKTSAFDNNDKSQFFWVAQPFGPRKILDTVHNIVQMLRKEPNSKPKPPKAPNNSTDSSDFTASPVEGIEKDESPETSKPEETKEQPVPDVEPLPEPDVPEANPAASTAPAPKQEDFHVLVVDDNSINLKIMATFMRKLGCTYDTATNGLIALEKYIGTEKPYNLVLMDISMPVMDGLESTSKIRLHEKETGKPPSCIMAVTGVASDSMQQQARAAGINDYLIKPLSLQELKKIMKPA